MSSTCASPRPRPRQSARSRTAAASHRSAIPPASHACPAPRAAPHAADASPYGCAPSRAGSLHPRPYRPYRRPQSSRSRLTLCANTPCTGLVAPLTSATTSVVIARVQPAHIAHLPARVRIEARRIQHHLARLAGLQLRHAHAILHQRQHLRAVHPQRRVALELRLRQLAIHRRRRLLRTALP